MSSLWLQAVCKEWGDTLGCAVLQGRSLAGRINCQLLASNTPGTDQVSIPA
jgi:hypothetical protein